MIPNAKDMFSSLLRPKSEARRMDSRFLDSNAQHPSPGLASREYLLQRHATADFTEGEEEEEDEDEDHLEDGYNHNHPSIRFADPADNRRRNTHSNPIIPLFSASHLGTNFASCASCAFEHLEYTDTDEENRFPTCVQCCPRYSNHCPGADRNIIILGTATLPTGLTVPGEADAATNSNAALQSRNPLCLDGELPPIWQGRSVVSR